MYEFGAPQQILTGFASWLHYCNDVGHSRPTKLCMIFGRLLAWYTRYTSLGAFPPDGHLPLSKFALHPSLAFSYIGSITARHSSSRHQPNFAAWYKEWNYGTFTEGTTYMPLGGDHVGIGPHSSSKRLHSAVLFSAKMLLLNVFLALALH